MYHKLKLALPLVLLLVLLAANIGMVSAHNWGGWHWDKSGTNITIQESQSGSTTAEAESARVGKWNNISILYNYKVSYHTDVTVFDGNAGNAGWAGLATIVSSNWDWGCWCYDHIGHGHAQYNTYYGTSNYGYIQGVYCQEVFHTYGFDHDNTGGCMGLGYYSGSGITIDSHNASDFYNRYRNH